MTVVALLHRWLVSFLTEAVPARRIRATFVPGRSLGEARQDSAVFHPLREGGAVLSALIETMGGAPKSNERPWRGDWNNRQKAHVAPRAEGT